MSVLDQTEKNSIRAYVFSFALNLGHCSTRSACLKGARSGHSRMGCPARRAVRRLRTVGGIGVVLGYSRDEPAGGERLQVCLHRVSNIVGIDLRSSALGIDWRYHRVRAAQVFAMKSSRS